MQSVNWAWGLSLIALTIAIHTAGVVMMAVAGLWIRARLETRNLGFWHMILIVIGVVGTAGLVLAVLHGIEAAIWAAAYVWLGALNLPEDAILYSVELYDHTRRFGADTGTTLADDGRPRGGKRHAVVRYQHGLHFRGDAGVLVDALRCAHDPPLVHLPNCQRPKLAQRRQDRRSRRAIASLPNTTTSSALCAPTIAAAGLDTSLAPYARGARRRQLRRRVGYIERMPRPR